MARSLHQNLRDSSHRSSIGSGKTHIDLFAGVIYTLARTAPSFVK